MKRQAFQTILLGLFVAAIAQAQSTCVVTGTLRNFDLSPNPNGSVTIIKVIKAGAIILNGPYTIPANPSGVVTFTVPRASTIYVYADAPNLNKSNGVALPVPDAATANLEEMVPISQVPVNGLTLYDESTALAGLFGTLKFAGPNVNVAQSAFGQATVTISSILPDWNDIQNKPSSFPPSAHAASHSAAGSDPLTLSQSQIANLVSDLAGKASVSHTHTLSQIIDAGTAASKNFPSSGNATMDQVVLGSDTRLTDARVPLSHTHTESEITNLVTDLAAKVPTTRTITAGVGLNGGGDLSANRSFAVDLSTLVANQTIFDSSQSSRTITFGLSGSNDPVVTVSNNSFDLSTGTLKQGGTAVSLAGHTHPTSDIISGQLALARGGTGADLSATGPGFLKQATTGAAVSVAALVAGDIPDLSATYQPLDGDLTALAALSSAGMIARTAANTYALRSVAVGANLSIANGDGVSGNPTISLGASVPTSVVNDTNVTGSISGNALTLGWIGNLAKTRQHSATVYNDAGNTYSAGAQDFGSASLLKIPTSAGAAPTANGLLGYDSTANAYKFGVNGSTKTVLMTDGSGANLTNLNASNLASGTVPLARLSGITNTEVAPSAAIAYSKLNLSGSIIDADVNSSAAINWTKISKSGSSLADLATRSAADLSSGILLDARLSSNVPLKDVANVFSAVQEINTGANADSTIDGLRLANTTAATDLIPAQHAPVIVFEAHGGDSSADNKWEMNEALRTRSGGFKARFSWEWNHNEGGYNEKTYIDANGNLGTAGYFSTPFQFLITDAFDGNTIASFGAAGIELNDPNGSIDNFDSTNPLRFITHNTTASAFQYNASSTLTSGNLFEGLVPDSGFTGSLLRLGRSSDGTTVTTVLFDVNEGGYVSSPGHVFRSGAGDPTTSDIAASGCAVWKNTSSGAVKLWCNDGGTLKGVVLN